MISVILSVDGAYDGADTDDQPRSGSQYLSKRDLKWILAVIVLLTLILWPIYGFFKQNSEATMCRRNLNAIFKAISTYAEDNDGKLPPVYEPDYASGAPIVRDGAVVNSWVGILQARMGPRVSFVCPSSDPAEHSLHHHPTETGRIVRSSYGFYAPLGLAATTSVVNVDNTVMITETSNFGANGTYNPLPFEDADGNPVRQDGFVVGFNDSNDLPTDDSRAVTRLAFGATKDGTFDEQTARPRHRDGIHALMLDGRLRYLTPRDATIDRETLGAEKRIRGIWTVPLRQSDR